MIKTCDRCDGKWETDDPESSCLHCGYINDLEPTIGEIVTFELVASDMLKDLQEQAEWTRSYALACDAFGEPSAVITKKAEVLEWAVARIKADAEKRLACEIMTRRRWHPEPCIADSWRFPLSLANDMIRQHGANAADFKTWAAEHIFASPEQTIIKADDWYKKNVEASNG